MIIAVDIDGVLTVETEGHDYLNRTPNIIAKVELRDLITKGHSILYYTARPEQDRTVTTKWLNAHGFPNAPLFMGKPQADIYVDDKAVRGFDEL